MKIDEQIEAKFTLWRRMEVKIRIKWNKIGALTL